MAAGTQAVRPADLSSSHPTVILDLPWGWFLPKSSPSPSGKGLIIGPRKRFTISYNLSRYQSWAFKFVRTIETSFSGFFVSAWTLAIWAGDCFQSYSGQFLYNHVSHRTTEGHRNEPHSIHLVVLQDAWSLARGTFSTLLWSMSKIEGMGLNIVSLQLLLWEDPWRYRKMEGGGVRRSTKKSVQKGKGHGVEGAGLSIHIL